MSIMDATAGLDRTAFDRADLGRKAATPARKRAAKGLRRLRRKALDLAASAQDSAKDLAEVAQERARDIAGTAQGRARDLAGVAQDRAKDMAGAARKRAKDRIDARRSAAAEALESIAANLRPRVEDATEAAEDAVDDGRMRLAARIAGRMPMAGRSTILLAGALGLGVALGMVISNQVRARREKTQTRSTGPEAIGAEGQPQLAASQGFDPVAEERDAFNAQPTAPTPYT